MITEGDLQAALRNDRHAGWGYALTRDHGPALCKKLDREVVAAANRLELTPDELFEWTNSKYGRWLNDELDDLLDDDPIPLAARTYLNRETMNTLAEELGWERRWTEEDA